MLEKLCINEDASSGSLPPVVSMMEAALIRGNETNRARVAKFAQCFGRSPGLLGLEDIHT